MILQFVESTHVEPKDKEGWQYSMRLKKILFEKKKGGGAETLPSLKTRVFALVAYFKSFKFYFCKYHFHYIVLGFLL